jgi:hypothetical protein
VRRPPADEAGNKGDLAAASKCATDADKAKSEKKLEDAADKAKKAQTPMDGVSQHPSPAPDKPMPGRS